MEKFTNQHAVKYYTDNQNEFYGEEGNEILLQSLKKNVKPMHSSNVLGLDVGACVGDYLIHIHDICPEATTQILCFEPNPANFFKLRSQLHKYPQASFYPFCISDKEGEASFYNWKDLTTNQEGNLVGGLRSGGEKICDVEVRRLDTLLDEDFKDKDCIIKCLKIDTEGNDTNVIKSLGKYIEKTHYILFECSDCLDDTRGPGIKNPMKDIVDYLSQHGFDTYRIGTKKLLKVNDEYWDETYEKVKFWSNCFALRKDDSLIHKVIDESFSYIE